MSSKERQVNLDTSEMNVLFVHSALDDYPLTPEEFRVYAHLARRASSGAAYPSVTSMASNCRMHPDTVRRCLQNLIAFKMLEAHERKGRTTLYTLAKFSRWVRPAIVEALHLQQAQTGAAKRAAKRAAKEEEGENPPETEGGVGGEDKNATPPKQREGYPPETEGDHPSETKGDEGNPLRISIEGSGVSNVTGNAREDAQPSVAPAVEHRSAPHTTGQEVGTALKAVCEPSAQVSVMPPDGGAAIAAITDTDLKLLFGISSEGLQEALPVTAEEDVPPAGAAAQESLPVSGVDFLMPVPPGDLSSRPLAIPTDTTYRLVKGLVGGNKAIADGILDTLTPAGALSRRDWLRLTEEELAEVRTVAQAEAQAHKLNFYTVAIRALDRLIGAPIGQTTTRGRVISPVTPNAGSHAPAAHYKEADRSGDVGKYAVGARWIPKDGHDEVLIERTEVTKGKHVDGLIYHLSNGKTRNALQLMTGYRFSGPAEASA